MNDINLKGKTHETSVSLSLMQESLESQSQGILPHELCWFIPSDGSPLETKMLNGTEIECLCIQLNSNDHNNKPTYVFIPLVDLLYKTSYTYKNLKSEINNLKRTQQRYKDLTIKQKKVFSQNELVKAIDEICKKQGFYKGINQVAKKALNQGLNVVQKQDGLYGHGRIAEVQTSSGKAVCSILNWLKVKKNKCKNNLGSANSFSDQYKEKSDLDQTVKDNQLAIKKLQNTYKDLEHNRDLLVPSDALPLQKRRFNFLTPSKRKYNEKIKIENKLKELKLLNAARMTRCGLFDSKIIQCKEDWVKENYKNEEIFKVKLDHFNKRKKELLGLIREDEKLINSLSFKLSDFKIQKGYGCRVVEFFNRMIACVSKIFSCCTCSDDEEDSTNESRISMSYSQLPREDSQSNRSLSQKVVHRNSQSASKLTQNNDDSASVNAYRNSQSESRSKHFKDELSLLSQQFSIIESYVKEGAFLDLIQITYEFLKVIQKHKESLLQHQEVLGTEYYDSVQEIRLRLARSCEGCLANLVAFMTGKKELITNRIENQVNEVIKLYLTLNTKSEFDQDEALIFNFLEDIRKDINFDLKYEILIQRVEVLKNINKLLAFENINFDEDLTSKNSENLLKTEMNEYNELYQKAKQIRKNEAVNLNQQELEIIQSVEQRLRVAIAVRNTKIKNLDADKILRGLI